jgi:phosphoribosylaminoimidazolecarboxamide formyltransferase/IMP cyclohydrolase
MMFFNSASRLYNYYLTFFNKIISPVIWQFTIIYPPLPPNFTIKIAESHHKNCPMAATKKIATALVSVFYKDGLDDIVHYLHANGVKIYSTGGTLSFIESLGVPAISVESLTGYPSILGGRVKTLHPKVFGGILSRRDVPDDSVQLAQYGIPEIDLVIVDLYPFESTVASGAPEDEVVEKIDIGGISLIRATAKNFNDVAICASRGQYTDLLETLQRNGCGTTLSRRRFTSASVSSVIRE